MAKYKDLGKNIIISDEDTLLVNGKSILSMGKVKEYFKPNDATQETSGLMSAEDKTSLQNISDIIGCLKNGTGVLMGSVFWNVGMQSVDTRYIDLDNISSGEKSGGISIPNASSTTRGFMSSADKKKLDSINTVGGIYRGLYEAAGAVYNEETGYYELNGLEDITEEQMGVIYADSVMQWASQYPMRTNRARTLFPTPFTQIISYWYFGCPTLENIRVTQNGSVNSYNTNRFAAYCSKLKKIMDVINITYDNRNPIVLFENDSLLEDFKIKALHQNATIEDSPLLTLATVSYLIEEATNTAAITVSVHPDVYAKLTDSANTDWYAVNTAAQAKQISFATTDAQAAAISLMNVEEPLIKQETTGELTEIAAPAGYYLTQAGETDGRMYFTRKVFVNGDSLDNYRLATSDEYEAWKEENENNITN